MLVWKRLFISLSLLLGNVYVKLDCACPRIRRESLLDCLISRANIQNGAQLEGKEKNNSYRFVATNKSRMSRVLLIHHRFKDILRTKRWELNFYKLKIWEDPFEYKAWYKVPTAFGVTKCKFERSTPRPSCSEIPEKYEYFPKLSRL